MSASVVSGPCNPLERLLASIGDGPIEAVDIAVAYVSRAGLSALASVMKDAGIDPKVVTVISGSDVRASDLLALREVGGDAGWTVLRHPEPLAGRFHPKYYAVRTDTTCGAYYGSHNATGAAFEKNVEAGLLWVVGRGSDEGDEQQSAFGEWRESALEITEEFLEMANEARVKGLGAGKAAVHPAPLETSGDVARFFMAHPEYTPCLESLGATQTAMDLALAFDYLRVVKGVDLPLDLCLTVVRRCNSSQDSYGHIPADIHRAFQALKAETTLLWEVVEAPETWPDRPDDVPHTTVKDQLKWLLASAERAPLTHTLSPGDHLEWAYTLDYLYMVQGVELSWETARTIVRRSAEAGPTGLVQPDTLRGAMRKAPEFERYKHEKGWD